MIHLNFFETIYLHREYVDFRKSINGLAAIVQEEMRLELFSKSLFIFCCKDRRRIKILYWDKTGFVLCYKRLEEDRFPWCLNEEGDVLQISKPDLKLFLRGINIWQIHKEKKYFRYC